MSLLSEKITVIKSDLFYQCVNLKEVIIPDTVETIGTGVLNGCSGLKKVTIPASAESSFSTYYGCTEVEEIVYSAGTGEMYTISNDSHRLPYIARENLKKVSFEEGITRICNVALKNCYALEEVKFPDSLEEIGASAFYGCSGWSDIMDLPDKLKVIGANAFDGCSSLSGNLDIP